MKVTLLLTASSLAAAGVLETRQRATPKFESLVASPNAPRVHATSKRTLTSYGPFILPASKGGAAAGGGGMGMGDSTLGGTSFMLNMEKGICSDKTNGPCTVFGGNVSVYFEDGRKATPADGIYIHHLLTTDRTKKATNFLSACDNPTRAGMSVSGFGGTGFVGVGEDSGEEPVLYTQRDGQSKAGYWVAENDKFMANVVLVNYNKEQKSVTVKYDLEWSPTPPPANTRGMLVSISQCPGKGSIKMSPSGPANSTSGKFTFLEDGVILAARGHLHDGGSQVAMYVNNKPACASKATYGGKESTTEVGGTKWATISSMSYCDGPIPIKKGDQMHLVVEYDLKAHPLRKSADGHDATGVMGMMSVTFASSAKDF
ncbi:hypothetical protein EJ08DRAFT_655026 [Tothia fuscella]|uniref:Uncharacterized protein n=1 Tax=Tothia fuscella TaxID=1048955 RepID=A0A9P4P5A7_9PEZI|nr:hypothetical protein EJ08DRAFT_655026 [Tothia fuscella]